MSEVVYVTEIWTGIRDAVGNKLKIGSKVVSTIGLFEEGTVMGVEKRGDNSEQLLVRVKLRSIVTGSNPCRERFRIYRVKGSLCKLK
ncbi:MAG: hypothetical protein M0P69_07550 [Bacteroidales bacterium]|nr:hypothetical protein [Bacteroidales bacterium]